VAAKVRGLKIAVTLTVVISLAIVLLVPPSLMVGITRAGVEGHPLPEGDFSPVPQSVIEDATSLAAELCEDSQEKSDDLVNQLLAAYLEARDKDFGTCWKLPLSGIVLSPVSNLS
jgi:hypothetical protein